MAKAKQGPDLLAEIKTRTQVNHEKNPPAVIALRERLPPDLLEAFDAAVADRNSYSAESIATWIGAKGYVIGSQAIRKWRRERR